MEENLRHKSQKRESPLKKGVFVNLRTFTKEETGEQHQVINSVTTGPGLSLGFLTFSKDPTRFLHTEVGICSPKARKE